MQLVHTAGCAEVKSEDTKQSYTIASLTRQMSQPGEPTGEREEEDHCPLPVPGLSTSMPGAIGLSSRCPRQRVLSCSTKAPSLLLLCSTPLAPEGWGHEVSTWARM